MMGLRWRSVALAASNPERGGSLGAKRQVLIGLIFAGALPTARAGSYSVAANPIAPPANCARIDVAVCSSQMGNTSTFWVFVPSAPVAPSKFIYYSAGHAQHFYDNSGNGGKDTIDHYLAKGFYVVGGCMPGMGTNPVSFVSAYDGATVTCETLHQTLCHNCLDNHKGVIRPFLEPYIQMTNELVARWAPAHLYATGISGGAWTTHLHAAIDVRIERSYPVAGAVTYDVGMGPGFYDDEQDPGVKETAVETGLDSWRGVFALGAYPHRRQMHCLNSADPAAYEWLTPVDRQTEYRGFESDVKALLGSDGSYDLQLTVANVHSVVPSQPYIDTDLGI